MVKQSLGKCMEAVLGQLGVLRGCFSRQAPFETMLAFTSGVLRRRDALGITSVVRACGIKSFEEGKRLYHGILRFFRSTAWVPATLMQVWAKAQMASPQVLRINHRKVLIADHSNNTKEGRYMPGVRNVHQSSETSSKPDFCRAQQWGCVAVAQQAPTGGSAVASPVYLEMHRFQEELTMLERPVAAAIDIARQSQELSYLVVDAAFTSGSVLKMAAATGGLLHTISRCRKDAVAYEAPPPREKGQRGRSRIYGRKIKLADGFKDESAFITEKVEGEEIRHCKLELRSPMLSATRKKTVSAKEKRARKKAAADKGEKPKRGRPKKSVQDGDATGDRHIEAKGRSKGLKPDGKAGQAPSGDCLKLSYFLIVSERGPIVLVSTDLELGAVDAYRLYRTRPAIESFFRTFKTLLHGFDSHFWSRHIKRASRTAGVDRNEDLDARLDSEQAQAALKATEGHAVLMAILCGALQNLCLRQGAQILEQSELWMRTPSQNPSEFLLLMLIQAQEMKMHQAAA